MTRIFTSACTFVLCATVSLWAQKTKLPNIVFILADDMGVGDISSLNKDSKIHTPNLDLLVENGMNFTDAHTAASVCTPTRYGLLTGRYPWRSELKKGVTQGYSKAVIKEEVETVAELLKKAGYTSAVVGKWHLGFNWTFKKGIPIEENLVFKVTDTKKYDSIVDFSKPFTKGPIDCGFDYFYGMVASPGMGPYTYLENNRVVTIPNVKQGFRGPDPNFPGGKKKDLAGKQKMIRGGVSAPNFDHSQVMLTYTQKSQEYIRNSQSEQPFFLYIPYAAPHTPVLPRTEFIGTSKAGIYGDFIQELDWSVGAIMQTLKEKGILDNTMVIFSADNGYAVAGFPEVFGKKYQHRSSREYRGHKFDLYEGGHRVPFIVHWPKQIKTKKQCHTPISLNDLFATCAELTKATADVDQGVDSYSILDLLKGGNSYERPNFMFSDYKGGMAVRKGDYKLILGKKKELFDLKNDISETTNLIDNPNYSKIAKDLLKTATDVVTNGRTTKGKKLRNEGPEYWRELRPWIQH